MKRTLQTLIMAVFVVLITASFSFAEYVASTAGNFPYFQLGCLVMGGLIITSLKHKYSKIYMSEGRWFLRALRGAGGALHGPGGGCAEGPGQLESKSG